MSVITFTTKDLPSRGLFYDRVYKITLKSLDVGQYKELMRCNEKYFKFNIINVLNNIADTDGLDIGDMYYGDVIAIIMWYKCNSSNDTGLEFSYTCEKCKNKIQISMNLGEFDEVTLDENIGEGVTLPNGTYLKYSPKKFLEYKKSTNILEHICNVFSYLTIEELDSMDLEDFLYLKDVTENFEFGFRYRKGVFCRMCRAKYNMEINAEYSHILYHQDYNMLMKNVLLIAKYTNYRIFDSDTLFDFETSIGLVNEMVKDETNDLNTLRK